MTILEEFLTSTTPEETLMAHLQRLITQRRQSFAVSGAASVWQPGQPLRLLLSCYGGGGNIGADIRVVETIRQIQALIGRERVDLGVLVVGLPLQGEGFATVRQEIIETYFPLFLDDRCAEYHGVVAAEGSLFKSNFSNAYSAMIAASLGLATAEKKFAIAYGAEAGRMSDELQNFVRENCQDALILCRNEASRHRLEPFGLRAKTTTDTAWTFSAAPAARGSELLYAAGWDGERPLLCLCPLNPFWWPIRADLQMAAELEATGKYQELHYGSIFFHHHSPETERKYRHYLSGFAGAVRAFLEENPAYFPVIVGMERLDRHACHDLAALLPGTPPCFVSGDYDMYEIVSILRLSSLLVSSRFHAIVSAMPALVPTAGVSLDERIENLMHDRGDSDLVVSVDAPDLEERLITVLRTLSETREAVRERTGRMVADQVRKMGEMGIAFLDELERCLPDFERPVRVRSWATHLPTLPPHIVALLEQYD